MPDRYEIRRRKNDPNFKWDLHRTDDDEDFGFTKLVGLFRTKAQAKAQLAKIKAHPNMNFAEWFYAQESFYLNETLDEAVMERHYFGMWRRVGGHLTVDAKLLMMIDMLISQCYVVSSYEDKIDDILDGHAAQMAGDSW